ncbi:tetratricopeptide repeat protein [Massilibacteroides sp.]|uniref:tetratricopeptide repeat protein n=1 Tax=Massilibacteroides sp. TaxID=2034766 RepID=UPI0026166ACF|nr:tetratricopeptide repeat protein [Massilibacteroides sp.]MDD4513991.1 tetratricopeptide repeat protein [Massilibacteroides sp.]
MANFFTSLFSSSVEETTDGMSKSDRKKFDILKYDGVRAQKIGKLPYAIKCFTEALAINDDLETMSYLVGAYTMIHEPEKALDVLDQMIKLDPELLTTLFTRVSVLFMLNREKEAIEECLHIITLEPSNHLAYYLMAKAKKNLADMDGALDDITKGIAVNEDFSDAYLLRAEIWLAKENGNTALDDIEHVISKEGEEENAYLLRAKIHMFLNNLPAAEEDYNKVLELNPFNEEGALKLIDLLILTERYEDALIAVDELIELSPSLSDAYTRRGKIKQLTGDENAAEADMQKAEELRNVQIEHGGQVDFSNLNKGAHNVFG